MIGWAIVNDHGKIPHLQTSKIYCIFTNKKNALAAKLKADSVLKVEIREVESKPIPPTKRKHHYCR